MNSSNKLTNKLILIAAVVGLSACTKKIEYTPPELNFEIKYGDILKDAMKGMEAGGQPGVISLNGVVVKSDGTPDNRISLEQTVGKSVEKTEILPASLPHLNANFRRKEGDKPSKLDTYLNVGCHLEGDSRIEGMKESKNKQDINKDIPLFGAAAMMVDKVFICGKVDVTERIVLIYANEVYLDNVLLTMYNNTGSFTVISDILSVEGKNLISTSGVSDSMASLLSGPSITLDIFERFVGSGDLKLKSAGGDNVPGKGK